MDVLVKRVSFAADGLGGIVCSIGCFAAEDFGEQVAEECTHSREAGAWLIPVSNLDLFMECEEMQLDYIRVKTSEMESRGNLQIMPTQISTRDTIIPITLSHVASVEVAKSPRYLSRTIDAIHALSYISIPSATRS